MIVGKLVQIASMDRKNLDELTLDELNSINIKGIKPGKLMDLIQNTSVTLSLKERKSKGSSGLGEQKRMLNHRTKKIISYSTKVKKQSAFIKKSFVDLSKKVQRIIK